MLTGTVGSQTSISILTSGDSLHAEFQRPEHPASLWTAQFVLMRDGSKIFKVDANPNVDNFVVDITSAQSLTITPGAALAVLLFTETATPTNRVSEYVGDLTVLPNPLDILAPSDNQATLTAITEAIKTIVGSPEHSASFNGQSFTLQSLNELIAVRDRYQALVDAEMRAIGASTKGSFKIIRNRFR